MCRPLATPILQLSRTSTTKHDAVASQCSAPRPCNAALVSSALGEGGTMKRDPVLFR